jgi:hypothetical protein
LIVVTAGLAVTAAFPHGASKGLHLHVSPEAAQAGGEVEVRVDAAEPVTEVRVSFVDGETVIAKADRGSRAFVLQVVVPEGAGAPTQNVHAEATARSGRTLRASAVVRISPSGTTK